VAAGLQDRIYVSVERPIDLKIPSAPSNLPLTRALSLSYTQIRTHIQTHTNTHLRTHISARARPHTRGISTLLQEWIVNSHSILYINTHIVLSYTMKARAGTAF
jgi:hypothetical protein